jgi:predicted DCC family thiol-disulfide oxidoreductase YuxK
MTKSRLFSLMEVSASECSVVCWLQRTLSCWRRYSHSYHFYYLRCVSTTFPPSFHHSFFYHSVCNFCNGGVNLCLDWDDRGYFRYASLQSKVGQSLLLQNGKDNHDLTSIVLVTPDKAYFHSDAILRIARELDGLPGPLRLAARGSLGVVPSFMRDAVYNLVAANRYMFGETDGPTCRLDLDGTLSKRFVDDPVSPPPLSKPM